MNADALRDQLRGLLEEGVYAPGPEGDRDFLEDFELVVRSYRNAQELAALERIRAAHYTPPKRSLPERGAVFPWLTGEQEVT